jgi:2-polyprenyl-3-methyl-5-hydroxy-6-metoxy-1,4-benzoquinol methylase
VDAALRYDTYWREREADAERTAARSRARAVLALALLERRGTGRAGGGGGAAAQPGRAPFRLLEVGCGPGYALEVFAAAGYDADGVDVAAHAVERACARGLRARVLDVEREDFGQSRFDAVVLLEVLEHLSDPLAVLLKARAALAAGGVLVVSLPNEIHLVRRLAVLCGRMGFGGHDDPHLRHFDASSARRLFAAAGLRVVAQASDSVVPPRRRLLRALTAPLNAWLPGLFAVARVYLLCPASEGAAR